MTTIRFALLMMMTASWAGAEWTPPAKPDPQLILRQAADDMKAERYEDALAKQVWFHKHALEHSRSWYGVRLSFALSSWIKLGEVHPPALAKLQSIRDDNAKKMREGSGTRADFHDLVAINRALKEEDATKDLFIWLDEHKSPLAAQVYELAQPTLVKAGEYKLCGRYIDADKSFERQVMVFRANQRMGESATSGTDMKAFGEKSFTHQVTTLVALLVRSERVADAERIMAAALNEWNDPAFLERLESAKQGTVPAPWP